ncbi:MAG: hotdog fold thioesterase [Pseudarcicella sp.]|jgi:1,4-dihydroxy-2-naphthoyl-CoA hydrolase|nr:hotdog fold thioesterase [Pseudarcicella sp.]MBP6411310.1 hotdog fold thioesterase [Pseudarcicella sp.]
MLTLEILNSFSQGTLSGHLGMKFTELTDDYLVATMPVDHRTVQPMGFLHGGASVALAETLGSVASLTKLENLDEQSIVGVEINANHLKSASTGIVTGKCVPLKIGKTLHVWEIKITNEAGELLCVSRITTAVIKKRKI